MRTARWPITAGLVALLVATAVPAVSADTALERVPGVERVKAVAASGDHYAALRADGTVWTWDEGADPPQPQQMSIDCRVRDVAAGMTHLAMICGDGTVWTAGFAIKENGIKRAEQAEGLPSIKAVSVGRSALVALATDGTVWISEHAINTKGAGTNGRMVTDLARVKAVAAGIDDFVAVLADGTAAKHAINTKGTGAAGRLPDLAGVTGVAVCGAGSDCDASDPYIFTTAGGKVVARGVGADGNPTSLAIGDLDGDGYIVAGHGVVLGVTPDGDGRLDVIGADGKVTGTDIKKPGPALKQVAVGASQALLLAADGSVWRWTLVQRPAQVQGLQEITAIASGGGWHVALSASNKLYCFRVRTADGREMIQEVAHVGQQIAQISAAADFYVTLNTDGSVAAGVCPAPGAPPAKPVIHRDLAARSLGAGDKHITLIKLTGEVAAARVDITAAGVQIGDLATLHGLDGAVQVAATETAYLVLRADGTVWGGLWEQPPVQVKDVAGARAIAAGGSAAAAILGDGSVVGITVDEKGARAGTKTQGDFNLANRIAGCSACTNNEMLSLRADGTVVAFSLAGDAGRVTGLTDCVAISAGPDESLALKADGTVWRFRSGTKYWQ